jgi:tyrosyl-tRNA synthetase
MAKVDKEKIKELLTRGVETVIVQKELEEKLNSGKKIRLYLGVDPTGPEIHLGHAVILWKLKTFQELGHEVILLIGDFTAKIGDPSDKKAIRQPLTDKEIKENMRGYKRQAEKILDFKKVRLKYNSKWLKKLNFEDVLNLASKFTVGQMLERDMYQSRIKNNKPIGIHEFMYPLMQGYDSVAMDVDLEVGGNDQTFNMLAGRTLQKAYNEKDKHVLAVKLLVGTDGRKMSKSYGNTIPLESTPEDMYGKIMSMRDEMMPDYFLLTTHLPENEIEEILKSSPRDAKARLAREVVALYHGESKAKEAEEEFEKVFKNKELPSNIEEFKLKDRNLDLVDTLVETKLASSKNEAKRLIEQGGVHKDGDIIRVGKRRFVRII